MTAEDRQSCLVGEPFEHFGPEQALWLAREARPRRRPSRRLQMKRREARIGPTVWELEGPMPILKSSKRLVFTCLF